MKNLLFLFIFCCSFLNAQYLVEETDISDNNSELSRLSIYYDLNNPLEFYRLKCENAVYAQFPGGENAFKQTLFNNLQSYLETSLYSVNGTFEIILFVTKSGSLQGFQLKPEVPNSTLLYRDLELALRRMNAKWIPANCGGVPIESKLRQKVNFRTEAADI